MWKKVTTVVLVALVFTFFAISSWVRVNNEVSRLRKEMELWKRKAELETERDGSNSQSGFKKSSHDRSKSREVKKGVAYTSKTINARYPKESDVYTETCRESFTARGLGPDLDQELPVIYFVTPTYPRREQVAELTRLSQTLLNVKNLVWIIAEDAKSCSSVVSTVWLIKTERIPYVHLISPMPEMYKSEPYKPKGVSSRNAGGKWILDKGNILLPGVMYFGDDDNTYDLRLFEEIRFTKQVSMFPVGFVGTSGFSSPIVVKGKVVGFSDSWFEYRKFPVDMAGFAVNIELLKRHKPMMPYLAGHEETLFLQSLHISINDIEPLANDCTEILAWHTRTVKTNVTIVKIGAGSGTNLDVLMRDMSNKGLIAGSTTGKVLPVCMKPAGCKTYLELP